MNHRVTSYRGLSSTRGNFASTVCTYHRQGPVINFYSSVCPPFCGKQLFDCSRSTIWLLLCGVTFDDYMGHHHLMFADTGITCAVYRIYSTKRLRVHRGIPYIFLRRIKTVSSFLSHFLSHYNVSQYILNTVTCNWCLVCVRTFVQLYISFVKQKRDGKDFSVNKFVC